MGIVKKPAVSDFWSTDPLIQTPLFNSVMKRNRYQQILRFLHFNNNEQGPNPHDPNRDRMYKIRPLIGQLNELFMWGIQPEREICLDESLLLFKGRLQFRQYLPAKKSRFGIKIFQVCESASGYCYKFRIYAGKLAPAEEIHRIMPDVPGATYTDKITVYMVGPLLDCGYHLYIDNWYTSVRLFKYLGEHETGACGTIRKNRVPAALRSEPVEVDGTKAKRSGNVLGLKYRPKSTKYVHILSTIHNESTRAVPVRGRHHMMTNKPVAILDYNRHMGGVDRLDQVRYVLQNEYQSSTCQRDKSLLLFTTLFFM